jgi:hypothetical protein
MALLWWRAGRNDTADFATTSRLYVWTTLGLGIALAGSAALPASARLVAWVILAALYLLAVVAGLATDPTRPITLAVGLTIEPSTGRCPSSACSPARYPS